MAGSDYNDLSDFQKREEALSKITGKIGTTAQHADQIAMVLRDYPGARTKGLPLVVRELRERLGCEDEAPAVNFVPDAFRINEETQEIEIFEVEVTHPIPYRKLRDLGNYWAQWDGEDDHEWVPVLIQVDRFGTRHRRDLCLAYYEFLAATTSPTPSPTSEIARLNPQEQEA